jgi:metal-dependent amidase/aminoacylase/carboxypeptidase family protein
MASDVEVTIAVRHGYRDMVNNMALARRFGPTSALGRKPRERDDSIGAGSTDMGDVSHVVPSIHPWLAIVDARGGPLPRAPLCRGGRHGRRGIAHGPPRRQGLARTAVEFLADADLRAAVSAEWEAARAR